MEMRNLQKPGVSQTWIQRKSRSFLPYLYVSHSHESTSLSFSFLLMEKVLKIAYNRGYLNCRFEKEHRQKITH